MSEVAKVLRVLVIEDQGVTMMAIRKAFERAGHEVVGDAVEGETGYRLALELRPDVILTDYLLLGGLDGLELTRRIMRDCPTAIIVSSPEACGQEAIDAGAMLYLCKPHDSQQLLTAVNSAHERFQTQQQIEQEGDHLRDHLETRQPVEQAK